MEKEHLKKEIKQNREEFTSKISKLDMDKLELHDQLNQANANLRASEVSLSAVMETKESLYSSNRSYEKNLEGLKNQVHDEITARKLAEQKADSLQSHLEAIKYKKVLTICILLQRSMFTTINGNASF